MKIFRDIFNFFCWMFYIKANSNANENHLDCNKQKELDSSLKHLKVPRRPIPGELFISKNGKDYLQIWPNTNFNKIEYLYLDKLTGWSKASYTCSLKDFLNATHHDKLYNKKYFKRHKPIGGEIYINNDGYQLLILNTVRNFVSYKMYCEKKRTLITGLSDWIGVVSLEDFYAATSPIFENNEDRFESLTAEGKEIEIWKLNEKSQS